MIKISDLSLVRNHLKVQQTSRQCIHAHVHCSLHQLRVSKAICTCPPSLCKLRASEGSCHASKRKEKQGHIKKNVTSLDLHTTEHFHLAIHIQYNYQSLPPTSPPFWHCVHDQPELWKPHKDTQHLSDFNQPGWLDQLDQPVQKGFTAAWEDWGVIINVKLGKPQRKTWELGCTVSAGSLPLQGQGEAWCCLRKLHDTPFSEYSMLFPRCCLFSLNIKPFHVISQDTLIAQEHPPTRHTRESALVCLWRKSKWHSLPFFASQGCVLENPHVHHYGSCVNASWCDTLKWCNCQFEP